MADAKTFLTRAENHLRRARTAAPHPTDWYDLTIYGFYCLEAAVMAAATHARLQVPRTHPGKAVAAEKLPHDHGLPDVSYHFRRLTVHSTSKLKRNLSQGSQGTQRKPGGSPPWPL